MVCRIKSTLNTTRARTRNRAKSKTLLIAGRNPDQLSNIFIIGKKDFLNEILNIAGGVNAYTGDIPYPNISLESVVEMNPDFIIELSTYNPKLNQKKMLHMWKTFNRIQAVKHGRIIFIKQNFWLRPGPRIGEIAKKMINLFSGQ
jgi:iron complex transport system substrate-binding protein